MTTQYHRLSEGAFAQDWTDGGLIRTNDDWSGVPSIVSYRGDDLTTATGADPGTLIGTCGVIDVNANHLPPTPSPAGGGGDFAIAAPTVALGGCGTADAPYIVVHLDA